MKAYRSILILISNFSIALTLLSADSIFAQRTTGKYDGLSYKRSIVNKIRLEGVKSFDKSEIKELLFTKSNHWYNVFKKRVFSKSNVNLDAATIKRFYARRGFLKTDVQSGISHLDDNKTDVTFYIYEGPRTYLTAIELRGGLEAINTKFGPILQTLKIGAPVNDEEILSEAYKLRDLYADNGYPYTIISREYNFNQDSAQAGLTYAIAESVFTVNGLSQTVNPIISRPYIVKREIVARPGKMYRQKDVIESEQRLYSTGLFKFVGLRRNDSMAVIVNDTCHVGFNLGLSERKLYFTNFGLGLGNTRDYFDLVLRSYGQLGVRNIAGTGRKIILSIKPYFQVTNGSSKLSGLHLSDFGKNLKLTIIRSTFELDYVTPWLLSYRIPVTAKVIWEPYTLNPLPPNYRYDRAAAEAVFSRELDQFTTARLSASTEYINIRNVPPGQAQTYRELGDNRTRRKLLLYIERDSRDNIFVPQKGSYSFVGLDYVGGILKGDFSYLKAQFSWSRYKILIGQNILANRIWLGWLDDRFKNGLSARVDRFNIGGSTTIRGYNEKGLGPVFTTGDLVGKPAGGRYLIITNLELRRPLFWRFGGTVFLDAGNTYARIKEITPLSIRFSAGMGLQFFTPIGPIRFDYAMRLKKQFDLGAGLYHLSILYAF